MIRCNPLNDTTYTLYSISITTTFQFLVGRIPFKIIAALTFLAFPFAHKKCHSYPPLKMVCPGISKVSTTQENVMFMLELLKAAITTALVAFASSLLQAIISKFTPPDFSGL